MIKLLITDLDDTLYDWTGFFVPAFYAMAEEISSITGIEQPVLLEEYHKVHQELGTLEFPYATLRLPSIRAHFNGLSHTQMKMALRPAFNRFNIIREEYLHLFPGVEDTLEHLYQRGIDIIGYTESSQENGFYRLQKLGVDKYFKHVYAFVSSFKSGYAVDGRIKTVQTKKPDVAVLRQILEAENKSPEEVLYVGDSLIKDIYMAKHIGTTAVLAQYPDKNVELGEKLYAITSWTEEDFALERRLSRHMDESGIKPDYIISAFPQLLDIL